MKRIDKCVNILWLSDIHWITDYSLNPEIHGGTLKPFLDSFLSFFDEGDDIKITIDYIIITGDLAQKGKKEEYKDLFEKLINPLQKKFNPAPQLILVPGNHDLDREIVSNNRVLLDNFIAEVTRNETLVPGTDKKEHFRESFFEKHKDEFHNFFYAWSQFCSEKIKTINTERIIHSTYSNKVLYGYVLDTKSKLIFIILNTAWYSLGDLLLEHYVQPGISWSDNEINVSREKISLITDEYGKQILALDLLSEFAEVTKLLDRYPEYTTCLLQHHPSNWLIRYDQIPDKNYRYTNILTHADCILSGHEHVLIKHRVRYFADTLHLETGAFMNVPAKDKGFKADENWFALLEINTTKRTLKQKRINYNHDSNFWNAKEPDLYKLKRKQEIVFSVERINEIKDRIKANPPEFIRNYFGLELHPKGKFLCDSEGNYYFLQIKPNTTLTDCQLKHSLKTIKGSVSQICFVFIDIFHNLAKEYSEEKNNRLVTLNNIKQDYDLKFDKFRHLFFSTLDAAGAIKYSEMKMTSTVIPFWEIEHLFASYSESF